MANILNYGAADLSLLSKYRGQLMGFAAMLIIIVHSIDYVDLPTSVYSVFSRAGYGVDIFLFLSGIGLYYSLDGKKATGFLSWYRKRFTRIWIPYTIIFIFFILLRSIDERIYIEHCFLEYTTLSFWLFHTGAWYIALLIPLYLVTPFLFKVMKRPHGNALLLILAVGIYLLSTIGIEDSSDNVTANIMGALQRVPGFLLGMIVAPLVKEERKIGIFYWLIIPLVVAVLFQSMRGWWFWVTLLPVVMVLALILKRCGKNIGTLLAFLGTMSLELYLTNIYLKSYLGHRMDIIDATGLNHGNYLMYALVIVIGVLSAWLFNILASRMINTDIRKWISIMNWTCKA